MDLVKKNDIINTYEEMQKKRIYEKAFNCLVGMLVIDALNKCLSRKAYER